MPDDRRPRGRPPRPPDPPDDQLREALELLATITASVSDRVDGQTDALDRMAKALAETRTAAFAARKQTDPARTADQVAAQVEHRLGHLLGDLRKSTTALGQKTATAGRTLDDLHAHAAGAKLTIANETLCTLVGANWLDRAGGPSSCWFYAWW